MIPTIEKECSDFLKLSQGKPLLRLLPLRKDGFIKVKVRHKKRKHNTKFEMIRSRAIFAYPSILPESSGNELFYIFPIDGFSFMYSENITESSEVYKKSLQNLLGNSVDSFLEEAMKYAYTTDDLPNGIDRGCEIIIWGIHYYYAIRKSLIPDYAEFLK